jgi:type II secretory pathway predicted ATPase ExeA
MVKEKLPEWLRDVRGWDEERINTAMEEIFKEDFKALMAKKIALDGADLQFFNLRQDPFLHPPRSTTEVFRSDEFEEILERVLDAIQYQGYIAVLGDIGSGKTTLKLMVEEALMERRNFNLIQPRFADMSKITATRVIQRLLKNFIDKAPANVEEAQHKCIGVLEEQYKNGQRTALMFDECHRLSDLTISTTKNFLEQYARGFTRFLGVVFLGQYSFESRLKDPAFSEIYQRVNIVQMPDFRGTLAEKYLAHRLKLIGAKVADLMDAEAVEYICANAPTPLMLGNIVNTALQKSREFSNEKVFGGFIKTQMHFPKDKAGPEFKLVGAGR